MISVRARKWIIGAWVVAVASGAAVGIPVYLRYARRHVSTDDAFVDGPTYYITPQINGKIASLLVEDNQRVERGQVVATLDTSDLEVARSIAQHNLEVIQNRVAATAESAAVEEARAGALRAQLEYAQKAKQREADLRRSAVATQSSYDEAYMNWKSLSAQLTALKRQRHEILLGLGQPSGSRNAEVELAKAQLRQAEQQLDHATLRSPIAGFVAGKRVELGQVVAAGQPLFAVVPLEHLYVTANYKETELTDVRVGQRVELHVDTYPHDHFEGRVDSIMAATGSVFSLIPPQNATGNFVKVVQRVPVKIALTDQSNPHRRLRVGMSVVPTILVDLP